MPSGSFAGSQLVMRTLSKCRERSTGTFSSISPSIRNALPLSTLRVWLTENGYVPRYASSTPLMASSSMQW